MKKTAWLVIENDGSGIAAAYYNKHDATADWDGEPNIHIVEAEYEDDFTSYKDILTETLDRVKADITAHRGPLAAEADMEIITKALIRWTD